MSFLWANWVSSKLAHLGIIQVSSLWVWCQLTPSLHHTGLLVWVFATNVDTIFEKKKNRKFLSYLFKTKSWKNHNYKVSFGDNLLVIGVFLYFQLIDIIWRSWHFSTKLVLRFIIQSTCLREFRWTTISLGIRPWEIVVYKQGWIYKGHRGQVPWVPLLKGGPPKKSWKIG